MARQKPAGAGGRRELVVLNVTTPLIARGNSLFMDYKSKLANTLRMNRSKHIFRKTLRTL